MAFPNFVLSAGEQSHPVRKYDDVEEQAHTVIRDTYYTEAVVRRKQLAARTEWRRQSAPTVRWQSSILSPTRRYLVPG